MVVVAATPRTTEVKAKVGVKAKEKAAFLEGLAEKARGKEARAVARVHRLSERAFKYFLRLISLFVYILVLLYRERIRFMLVLVSRIRGKLQAIDYRTKLELNPISHRPSPGRERSRR